MLTVPNEPLSEDCSIFASLIPSINLSFNRKDSDEDYNDSDLDIKRRNSISALSKTFNRRRVMTTNFTGSFSSFKHDPSEARAILESLMNKNDYNPFKIPASLELAKTHWECTALGLSSKDGSHLKAKVSCPCCNWTKRKKIPICQSPVTLKNVGSTIPLYFQFTNYLIGMTMFMFLAFFYPGLQQAQRFILYNQMEKGVELSFKNLNVFYMYDKGFYGWNCAGAQKGNFPGCTLEYLLDCYHKNIYLSSIMIFLLHLYCLMTKFYQMRLIQNNELSMSYCANTYTVMMDRVRDDQTDEDIKAEVHEMIEKAELKHSVQIVKVTKASMTGYMDVLSKQIEQETEELNQIRDNIITARLENFNQYKKFYKLTKNEIEVKKKKLASMKWHPFLLAMAKTRGVAFITFETHMDKGRLFRAYNKLKKRGCLCFSKHKLRHHFHDPPEPNDIRWHTIGYSRCHKIAQGLLSNIIYLLIMIPIFVAIDMCLRIFLYLVQNWLKKEHHSFFEAFFYGYSLIIILYGMFHVSSLLSDRIFNYLNNSQKMLTVNGLYTSHTIKGAFFKLLLYIGAATSSVGLSFIECEAEQKKILPFFSSIFMFMVVRIFIEPMMDIMNPDYLTRRQKQARIENMFKNGSYAKDKKLSTMTQQELNEIFSRPEPKIQDRYSKALTVALTQAFFLPFIPFIAIFAALGFFTSNLATRYVLYRRTKSPLYRTGLFSGAILNFTMLIPSILNLFNIAVFVLYSIFHWHELNIYEFALKCTIIGVNTYPVSYMFNICIQRHFENLSIKKCRDELKYGVGGNGMTYTSNSHLMFLDYDRLNPMTKKDAKQDWVVDKNLKSSLMELGAGSRSRRFGLYREDGRETRDVSLTKGVDDTGLFESQILEVDNEEESEEEVLGEQIEDDPKVAAT